MTNIEKIFVFAMFPSWVILVPERTWSVFNCRITPFINRKQTKFAEGWGKKYVLQMTNSSEK